MREQSTAAHTSLGSPASRATEFELARPDQLDAASVETALARNRAFAAAGGHEGATIFPTLRLFVITCLDPRVDPAHILGLNLGDAIVLRNGGGRVTPEAINNVAFVEQLTENVVPEGPLFEVAVIHHTQCGAGALANDDFRHRYARLVGADESVLREYAVLDPAATVATDVDRLRSAEAISPRVSVSGHVYDVVTGLVETVIPVDKGAWDQTQAVAHTIAAATSRSA
jgi:carbonic anhydrase